MKMTEGFKAKFVNPNDRSLYGVEGKAFTNVEVMDDYDGSAYVTTVFFPNDDDSGMGIYCDETDLEEIN